MNTSMFPSGIFLLSASVRCRHPEKRDGSDEDTTGLETQRQARRGTFDSGAFGGW